MLITGAPPFYNLNHSRCIETFLQMIESVHTHICPGGEPSQYRWRVGLWAVKLLAEFLLG